MSDEVTIRKLDRKECCGCSACMQKCPTKAISMEENEEGFLYPVIDKDKCINCGVCANICPQLSYKQVHNEKFPEAYACYNKDIEELRKSSSGGFFSVIAGYVLDKNGIVIGAAFDKNLVLKHIIIDNKKDLEILRGSKYVQSNINEMYKLTEEELKKGRLVLFTGTPCQIAGLKTFLMKYYDNLLTADIVCRGVPSQKIFSKYIDFLKEKYKSKIKSYSFRSKDNKGWGLTAKIVTESGKIQYKTSSFDQYYNAFLNCDIYRESCYTCKYTSFYRTSDITMADYWGILSIHPEFYSEKGVSLILVNTEKGKRLFDDISNKLEYISTDLEKASRKNLNLRHPSKRTRKRDYAYKNINEKSPKNFVNQNLKIRIKPKALINAIVPYKVKLLIKKARIKNND